MGKELSGVILINPMTKLEYKSVSFREKVKYVVGYIFYPSRLTVEPAPADKVQHLLDKEELIKKANDQFVVQRHSMRYMFEAKKLIDASIKNAKNAKSPMYLIYGEKDGFVDHSGSEDVYSAWNNNNKFKFIIKDGGHGAHTANIVWKQVLGWLKEQNIMI